MGNQQSGAGGGGGKDKVRLNFSNICTDLISCSKDMGILTSWKSVLQGDKTEKKKYEPPVPTRVGKKRKKVKVRSFWKTAMLFLYPTCTSGTKHWKKRVFSTAKVPYFCKFANLPFFFRMSGFVMYFLVVNCPFTHSFIHQYCHATGVKALTQTGLEIRIDHLSTRCRILRSEQTYF